MRIIRGTKTHGCEELRSKTLAVSLCLLLLSTTGAARADQYENDAGVMCTYEIDDNENLMQRVPAVFKFQSRISQAKLPVGDVVFETIYVNVKRGDELLCQESFNNVQVIESVLNLEIGRNMSCALDSVIAANPDLKFQICLGNQENCLKPISLSSVPYAIKSSFARSAQKAHYANEAVQCHYAHRMTADADLFTAQKIGYGYHDFHTPTPDQVANLIDLYGDSAMSVPYNYYSGGYIQWTQVDPSSSNLHICAQRVGSNGDPEPLKELVMHAVVTRTLGQMVIDGAATSVTRAEVRDKALTVTRSGIDIHGQADFFDDVTIGESSSHVCEINSILNAKGDVYIGEELGQGELDVYHDARFRGTVTLDKPLSGIAGDVECNACIEPGELVDWDEYDIDISGTAQNAVIAQDAQKAANVECSACIDPSDVSYGDYNIDISGNADNSLALDGQNSSYYRNADNINSGTLGTNRFSAYSDLTAELRLDNNNPNDLLKREQSDNRYFRVLHELHQNAGPGVTNFMNFSDPDHWINTVECMAIHYRYKYNDGNEDIIVYAYPESSSGGVSIQHGYFGSSMKAIKVQNYHNDTIELDLWCLGYGS